MGANAQTSVPLFTAGDVLTAANQNISAGTGVPVFASTTTRDAAFGGTGEKVLAEGQLCYIEASDVVQYYNGSVWATLGPSSGGGLVFLTGATFTTATSVSLPNSTFTNTYRNYKLILNVTAVTADADFTIRMRASGADDTNSNYNSMQMGANISGTYSGTGNAANTSWIAGEQDSATVRYSFVADILQPQTVNVTNLVFSYGYVNKANTDHLARTGVMTFTNSTQFDSLSFISSVASSISGNYRVYGYADS